MKKFVFLFSLAVLMAQQLTAQSMVGNDSPRRWYVGLAGGFNFSATEANLSNLGNQMNPLGGIRVGYDITPVLGVAAEWVTAFESKAYKNLSHTTLKHSNLSVLGTVSLGNLFMGGDGVPFIFDVLAVAGVGYGNYLGVSDTQFDKNDFTGKIGLDLALNFGARNEWQVYLEPGLTYAFGRSASENYIANNSMVSLLLGVNYKFSGKGGSRHKSRIAQEQSQKEIEQLNQQVNELRSNLENATGKTTYQERIIGELRSEIKELKDSKTVEQKTKSSGEGYLLPTSLVFHRGHTAVETSHHDAIALVVSYLTNHPTARLLIKGYAVSEGTGKGSNKSIAEARAQAVKDVMVHRYMVKENRLEVMGVADAQNMDEEYDFNRIVTFTDVTR